MHRGYGDPGGMIDAALSIGRFSALLDAIRTSAEEKANYEVWLNKVWDRPYGEFVKQVEGAKQPPVPKPTTKAGQLNIIGRSLAIAGVSFCAEGGES